MPINKLQKFLTDQVIERTANGATFYLLGITPQGRKVWSGPYNTKAEAESQTYARDRNMITKVIRGE